MFNKMLLEHCQERTRSNQLVADHNDPIQKSMIQSIFMMNITTEVKSANQATTSAIATFKTLTFSRKCN